MVRGFKEWNADPCTNAIFVGFLRMRRLVAIAYSSTFLSADAFRLAIRQAKEGINVELYSSLVDEFAKLLPDDPLAQKDAEWIQNQRRKAKTQTDRLEHELRQYRNNLIKESIRVRIKVPWPKLGCFATTN